MKAKRAGSHEDKPASAATPRAIHFHGPGYAASPSFSGSATFAGKTFLGVAPYLNT